MAKICEVSPILVKNIPSARLFKCHSDIDFYVQADKSYL